MKLNTPATGPVATTHEGGRAYPEHRMTPEMQLERTVLACLLWEDTFYEDGQAVGDRIKALVPLCSPEFVHLLALKARGEMNLRHAPLLLCRELARTGKLRAGMLSAVIQRADELAEFLAIYWADNGGRRTLSKQVKKGLALAFNKFGEYALAKYNRDGKVKLRDVLFLCHAKSENPEQDALWKRLAAKELAAPDTWEVALSAGADKGETFTRLILEGKLGALALLRNLRNMVQSNVTPSVINHAIAMADVSRVLPFRFIAAARYAPQFEPELEAALFRSLEGKPKLAGRTCVLVDVSGSMEDALSAKSDMKRMDAACGLAMVLREMCEAVCVYSFSTGLVVVPPRRGFGLRDAIVGSQPHHSTALAGAMNWLVANERYDRLVIVTDEQSQDGVGQLRPGTRSYLLNVGTFKNGVGYGKGWTHISGFSEACVRYIVELERTEVAG